MPFSATWMDLEISILSEVSQTKTNIYDFAYIWNLKYDQMILFTKQKQTHRHIRQAMVTNGERGRGGINQEYGVNRNTLLYVKQIKVLIMQHRKLYSIPIMINNLKKKTCMQVKKQQLEPDMEQLTGSKLGKEHIKAVY